MSEQHIDPIRRKHTQRIKLGAIIACTPWLMLGLVGLISAGVTAARAARLPIDEIRPLALVTLGISALVSVVGLAILILGVAGLAISGKNTEGKP
ncbi:hypothetical protein AY599_01235 [Leptolyngbya valderiana BDU 20041]|nr:hypothetical protein AY599_01235 [Leptolyngbya valderiana BDU 20041]